MKSNTTFKFAVVAFLLVCFACKKDDPAPAPDTAPAIGFDDVRDFLNHAAPQAQAFFINAQFPVAIRTEYGSLLQFAPNSFIDQDGNLATGVVEIQIIEYMDRAEMIFGNKPTMSNGQILVSGGQFNVEAFQDGNQLEASPQYLLEMSVPTNDPDPQMTLFTGTENPDGTVDWQLDNQNSFGFSQSDSAFTASCSVLSGSIAVPEGANLIVTYNEGVEPSTEHGVFINSSCGDFIYAEDEITAQLIDAVASTDCTVNFYLTDIWFDGWLDASLTIQVGTQTMDISIPSEGCEPNPYYYVYQIVMNQLGYINCDYFWTNPNPQVTIHANYPSDFNCENTLCYVVFPDILSVVGMICNDDENGIYMNGIPEGTEAVICALSYNPETDTFYSSITPITASTDLTTDLIFSESSLEEFEAYITGL
jgi:hypothetical protein